MAFALTNYDWNNAKGPCCGVLACAIAAQRPFQDAWDWFKTFGDRCWRNSWKGSTFACDYPKWFKFAGVKTVKHPGATTYYKRTSLQSWMVNFAKPNVPYFIITRGHAQILYNGKVRDQRGVTPMMEFWGKRKYVTDVWEIQVDDKAWQEFGLPLFDYKGGK